MILFLVFALFICLFGFYPKLAWFYRFMLLDARNFGVLRLWMLAAPSGCFRLFTWILV